MKKMLKFNIYHDKKVQNNISTFYRVYVVNNDVVNVDKNGMEESWKDTYEDTKIFKKKKKKLHERLTCRRYITPSNLDRVLNLRLKLISGKAKLRKLALFKIEEASHLGKANLKDRDARLFSVNDQKLKFHFGGERPNVPFEDPL
ncbi:DNA-directed DNA polymerase [Melia azedarach]|uniref:DNA-directed DNA polymerase n=1 Tax=Melia azedarach TaxID=155640 RepID=A0ACC1YIW2_MELAZ|nr:DNA-directed DNA polymerase [Melia azedarach]